MTDDLTETLAQIRGRVEQATEGPCIVENVAHATFQHSKGAVRRAGKTIVASDASPEEVDAARKVIASFRSAHAYPLLSVRYHVRNKAMAVSDTAIVAQRMKRLPTILDKLHRHPGMDLTRMQDFGGCRVIFDRLEQAKQLKSALHGASKAKNRISRDVDYVEDPRSTGYRGYHLIFDYRAAKAEYHGYKVELQIRSALQHSWATAVETVDLFSGSELKYGKGEPALQRYFAIVGSLMARVEGAPHIPNTSENHGDLTAELASLEEQTGLLGRLRGYANVVERLDSLADSSYLTLELARGPRQLTVSAHPSQEAGQARLAELESREDSDLDAVLIGLAQVGQLKAAFPNYFADTSYFVKFVMRAISRAHQNYYR